MHGTVKEKESLGEKRDKKENNEGKGKSRK